MTHAYSKALVSAGQPLNAEEVEVNSMFGLFQSLVATFSTSSAVITTLVLLNIELILKGDVKNSEAGRRSITLLASALHPLKISVATLPDLGLRGILKSVDVRDLQFSSISEHAESWQLSSENPSAVCKLEQPQKHRVQFEACQTTG